MKHLKMLGLAAIAAMALMAVLGAGSASAVTLCKTATNPCPEASRYPAETTLHGKLKAGTSATLTSSLGNVVCSESTIHGHTTNTGTGTKPLLGSVDTVTFSGCTLNGNACTVTVEHLPYNGKVTASSTVGNGTLTVESGGSGSPGAHVICNSAAMNCTFASKSLSFAVTGGSPATATISQSLEIIKNEGFICPSTAVWDAEYELTEPNPLFVVASP